MMNFSLRAAVRCMFTAFCLLLCGLCFSPVQALELLSEEKIECYGTFNGDDFWVRLLPANQKFGGMRIMELLYTPKKPKLLAGAVMVDHPQILLDAELGIHAWKEGRGVHQSGFGGIVFRSGIYSIAREVDDDQGGAEVEERSLKSAATTWDAQLGPIFLSFCQLDKEIQVNVVDFFGALPTQAQPLVFKQDTYQVAGLKFQVKRDEKGRLLRILDAQEQDVLIIKGWR